jgi:hypothetical protein
MKTLLAELIPLLLAFIRVAEELADIWESINIIAVIKYRLRRSELIHT